MGSNWKNLREPKEIVFKSFNEIFNHYFGITHKVWKNKVKKQQTECNFSTKSLKQKSRTDAKSEEFTNRFLNDGSWTVYRQPVYRQPVYRHPVYRQTVLSTDRFIDSQFIDNSILIKYFTLAWVKVIS